MIATSNEFSSIRLKIASPEDVLTWSRIDENSFIILKSLFLNLLKLLHPFMPFVTEELYKQLQLGDKMLIIEDWPQI
jgi:valyl-tRNA synthetase